MASSIEEFVDASPATARCPALMTHLRLDQRVYDHPPVLVDRPRGPAAGAAEPGAPRRDAHDRGEHGIDWAVEQVLPFVEPQPGLAARDRPHDRDLLACTLDARCRVADDLAGGRVGEPQASTVLATEPLGATLERFEVLELDPSMGADRCVRQHALTAQPDAVGTSRILATRLAVASSRTALERT